MQVFQFIHCFLPSSVPSMMDTLSSLDRNGDSRNSALTWTQRKGMKGRHREMIQLKWRTKTVPTHAAAARLDHVCFSLKNSEYRQVVNRSVWQEVTVSQRLTVSSRCLAFSPGSRRRPAVAFRTTGVTFHIEGGTLDFATPRSSTIPAVHWTHRRGNTEDSSDHTYMLQRPKQKPVTVCEWASAASVCSVLMWLMRREIFHSLNCLCLLFNSHKSN